MDSDKALVVFQGKNIRRTWYDGKWYFSVVDVVSVLTDSADAKDYWYRLKKRELESSEVELSTFCRQLKLPAEDNKIKGGDNLSPPSINNPGFELSDKIGQLN